MADQIDLLREQIKMLAGEVAFCTSSLKRLIEQAANNPDDLQIQVSFPLSCNTWSTWKSQLLKENEARILFRRKAADLWQEPK